MGRLNGKVAIITGAGRGIGRATAKLFAAEGAKVAVLSRTKANVDAVVADIEAEGGTALGIAVDVSDAEQIKSAIDTVASTWVRSTSSSTMPSIPRWLNRLFWNYRSSNCSAILTPGRLLS